MLKHGTRLKGPGGHEVKSYSAEVLQKMKNRDLAPILSSYVQQHKNFYRGRDKVHIQRKVLPAFKNLQFVCVCVTLITHAGVNPNPNVIHSAVSLPAKAPHPRTQSRDLSPNPKKSRRCTPTDEIAPAKRSTPAHNMTPSRLDTSAGKVVPTNLSDEFDVEYETLSVDDKDLNPPPINSNLTRPPSTGEDSASAATAAAIAADGPGHDDEVVSKIKEILNKMQSGREAAVMRLAREVKVMVADRKINMEETLSRSMQVRAVAEIHEVIAETVIRNGVGRREYRKVVMPSYDKIRDAIKWKDGPRVEFCPQ